MKIFLELKEQLYLVFNPLSLEGYEIIEDVGESCFLTSNLLGDEKKIILEQNHLLRPTRREPLIKGLYLVISKYGKEGYGKEALEILGDIYLESLDSESLKEVAGQCTKDRKKRFVYFNGENL